jgi:hypothetical protein
MLEPLEMVGFALTWVFSTCCFAVSLLFFLKIKQTLHTTKELKPFLALAFLCLSYGIIHIVAAWLDYYRWSQDIIVIPLWKSFAVILLIANGCFVAVNEYVLGKTKYLLSLFICLGIIPILLLNDFGLENIVLLIWGIPGFLISLPLYYLVFLKPVSGPLKKQMVVTFFGLLGIGMASVLRSDSLESIFGNQGYLIIYNIGTFLATIGICILGYGFSHLSTFTDLNWKAKLRELYIINSESGLCLYSYSFGLKKNIEEADLVAGGFSSIRTFLSEITKSKDTLQQIDYHDLKILMNEGKEHITTIVVIKESSSFIPYKLSVFMEEFQAHFGDILADWKGDASIFIPTNKIIEQVFELK